MSWLELADAYEDKHERQDGCTYNGCNVGTEHVYKALFRLVPSLQAMVDKIVLHKGRGPMLCLQVRKIKPRPHPLRLPSTPPKVWRKFIFTCSPGSPGTGPSSTCKMILRPP